MEIILTKQCVSLTGSLGRGWGYFIQARRGADGKTHFFSQRSKHTVPPDGHWKMIVACANLACMRLHLADIQVSAPEIINALQEAGYTTPAHGLVNYPEDYPDTFNADDVINLKNKFHL